MWVFIHKKNLKSYVLQNDVSKIIPDPKDAWLLGVNVHIVTEIVRCDFMNCFAPQPLFSFVCNFDVFYVIFDVCFVS